MFSSPPGALWILILEESHLSDGLWRVCVRGARGWVPAPSLVVPCERERKLGVEVGSPLVRQPAHPPPEIKHFSSLPCSCVPTNLNSSSVGSTPLVRSQNFYILFGISDPSQFPLQEEQTPQGICAHLNTCLSLCLGLPGPTARWLGLGVQPPSAAHAKTHLPGRGPLLHQQTETGRVAGTLEKGGETPSIFGAKCGTAKPKVSSSHPLGLLLGHS